MEDPTGISVAAIRAMKTIDHSGLASVVGGRLDRARAVEAMRLGREHAEANGSNGFIGSVVAGYGDLGRQFLRMRPWTPEQR